MILMMIAPSEYRGFEIHQLETHWEVRKGNQVYAKVNTGWSAQAWIDEFLQP